MQFALFQYIVILICGALTGLTSLYVFSSNRRRMVNRFFALFSGGIACWSFGLALLFFTRDPLFISLILEGGIMLATGIFFFGKVFPAEKSKFNDIWYFLPMIILGLLVPFKVFISDVTITPMGYILPHNEPLFFLYAVGLAFYMLGGVYFLIRKYVRASETIRVQLQSFFFGIVLFVLVSLLCDVILPNFFIFEFNLVGPVVSLFFVAATAYGIFRHNLMDIRIVIQRSLIYIVLVAIIIFIYILGLQFLGYILHKTTDTTSIVSAGITTMLGIFFIQPLKKYFEKVTDPLFFKNKYIYSDALEQLSRMLNTTMSQADVISASSAALKKIFKTNYVEFSLPIEGETYAIPHNEEVALSLPIIFENNTIGTVELGQKRSGEVYTYQDKQLLETFLHQAAVAIEKGRLYEKVEEYTIHLERTVEERTREIKKIQQDQKQTMIDISHNLQTPLAVIRNELELMTEHAPDPSKMAAANRSLMRVSDFIRQLLHLARLDGSVYDITFSAVDLSGLLLEQAEYFEVMGYEHSIKVTADIDPNIAISGNKRLLGEALTNLAQNAIKYRRMDIDSTLHLALKKTAYGITLTFEDNGIGIEKEDLEGIFTRFYRTSRGSEKSQGVGLGLTIVKRIFEMHNAGITVNSSPNIGTCFEIVFIEPTS